MAHRARPPDPQWYRDAILYEVHVRAFADGNRDGIGDFRGLTSRLDYIRALGCTAIWLLPFYPSPLRDDGYDIADYAGVHPDYGTLADFRAFLREAHARSLRVITELVLNHTSDRHPWFQRARRAPPGSPERDFYVWSDRPDRYAGARVIFTDTESSNWTWDPVAGAYFWHRFYDHQPDLNFDHPPVRRAVLDILDFWLDLGVDGLRLDAVPYLFEREGTSCENLPETHALLRDLRRHVDARHRGRMLLAEANQWPEDAVAYFGQGDEAHMAFHFPLMPRLFLALLTEGRHPVVEILAQTPPLPEGCQWALFLRNHDELTLEMVTEEERDQMIRVYAGEPRARLNLGIRRRLAPLLGNSRRRIELMHGLLLSLPGTPVLYYGDEIGMGDNIFLGDRDGVRTPMQWSADRNAGFSSANAQRLDLPVIIDPGFHYEAVNVEVQAQNESSLLSWMRRITGVRRRHVAFGRGTLEFLHPLNRKVLAYLRRHGSETLLVVANLSRHAQHVELDLSGWRGQAPVELFGLTRFPAIGDHPYPLTLGPHNFLWFSIEPLGPATTAPLEIPVLTTDHGGWPQMLRSLGPPAVGALQGWLRRQRWFGGKDRVIESISWREIFPLEEEPTTTCLALADVLYAEGEPETYLLPLALRVEAGGTAPENVIARLATPAGESLLVGDAADGPLGGRLLDLLARRRRLRGEAGDIVGEPAAALRRLGGVALGTESIRPLPGDHSHSSLRVGDAAVLKILRRVAPGMHPEVEIGRLLTETVHWRHAPLFAGQVLFRPRDGSEPTTLALLQGWVANQGDAWRLTLDVASQALERAASLGPGTTSPDPGALPRDCDDAALPAACREITDLYRGHARRLAVRTAEMHRALASGRGAEWTPEPFTPLYLRALYQTLRDELARALETLAEARGQVAGAVSELIDEVVAGSAALHQPLEAIRGRNFDGHRIRIHGDYHLGQVLYTGSDFVITDFEGEPALPVSARRLRRSPLRDVAAMVRSFHYAGQVALADRIDAGLFPAHRRDELGRWAAIWAGGAAAVFVAAYLDEARVDGIVPSRREDAVDLLSAYLLGRVTWEIRYEREHRPDRLAIPLLGLREMIQRCD